MHRWKGHSWKGSRLRRTAPDCAGLHLGAGPRGITTDGQQGALGRSGVQRGQWTHNEGRNAGQGGSAAPGAGSTWVPASAFSIYKEGQKSICATCADPQAGEILQRRCSNAAVAFYTKRARTSTYPSANCLRCASQLISSGRRVSAASSNLQ